MKRTNLFTTLLMTVAMALQEAVVLEEKNKIV
jgi:hypothetical protein